MKLYLFTILFLCTEIVSYSQTDSLFITSSFGDFTDAASVSSSRGENIFVSDIATNKIFKYNSEGVLLASYGGTGLGSNALNQPVSIDASNGLDIFVCDYLNNRIVRLDYKLNFVSLFDFASFNTQAESNNKIYNPSSITSSSTGELFVVCESGNFKVIRIREFSDINLYFGQPNDRISEPSKIVRGNELDIWVLDKSSNELLNFNNLGIFAKRVKLPDESKPVSVAYWEKNILVLFTDRLFFYDTEKGVFAGAYFISGYKGLKDINVLDKETILILQKFKVFKLKIN